MRLVVFFFAMLCGPSIGLAQLPLGGSWGGGGTPKLRLAPEGLREEAEALRDEIHAERAGHDGDDNDDPAVTALVRAESLVERALATLGAGPPQVAGDRSWSDIRRLGAEAGKLQRSIEGADTRAAEEALDVDAILSGVDTVAPPRHEALVQRAERLFDLARLGAVRQSIAAAIESFEPTRDETTAARQRLQTASDALAAWDLAHAQPAPADDAKGAGLSELELELLAARRALEKQQGELLKARVLAARLQTELFAVLGEPETARSGDLTPEDLVAMLLLVRREEQRVARRAEELARGTDPAQPRTRAALERVLESRIQRYGEFRAAVDDASISLDILQLARPQAPRSIWVWVLTALVCLAAIALYWLGQAANRRLTAPKGLVTKRFHLEPAGAVKVMAAGWLGWTLAVAAATAATLAWGVWRLDIGPTGILRAFDAPLIFVDETPVSVASLCKLVAAIVLALWLSKRLRSVLRSRVYTVLSIDPGLANALSALLHYGFVLAGVFAGMSFLGTGLSSFALLAGVLGIGIGFGLRNIMENFISGLIILLERPVQVGDWVDLDGKLDGRVSAIRARSTTVITRDNISAIIPNSHFMASQVINYSHGDPKVRLNIEVGVAYGSDTSLVRRVLADVAAKHGKVLTKPAAEVQFRSFGDSSLNFLLLVWIDQQSERFRIASDLNFAIDATFRRHNIVIPFPQRDLHIKSGLQPAVSDADTVSAETGGGKSVVEQPSASSLPRKDSQDNCSDD